MIKDLTAFEQGNLEPDDEIALFQKLIDTGQAWRLQGSYGRQAMSLIKAGYCTVGTERRSDIYGGVVPAIGDLVPGTIGTPEYVAQREAQRAQRDG